MRVVLTLLVRDEADIVERQLRYHYARGIDFVVATDHRSVDGTTEILRRFEAEGRLHYIREESKHIDQADWMTRMSRIAATEYGADWVIPSDADEFWWPRRGSFHEVWRPYRLRSASCGLYSDVCSPARLRPSLL